MIFHTFICTKFSLLIISINSLPSSFVVSDFTVLFGPSPTEVKANTLNSYFVYLESPMTSVVRTALSLISSMVCEPEDPFLKNNLNPLIIPFQSFAGGNCQDAVIMVEDFAVTVKTLGAAEGTAIEQIYVHYFSLIIITNRLKSFFSLRKS